MDGSVTVTAWESQVDLAEGKVQDNVGWILIGLLDDSLEVMVFIGVVQGRDVPLQWCP